MTLRDALAKALGDIWAGNLADDHAGADAILAHPAVAAWLREQDEALVALDNHLLNDHGCDTPLHAHDIAAARERLIAP